MLFHKFISQTFFDAISATFPASVADLALRGALLYLAFGFWFTYPIRGIRHLSAGQIPMAILEDKLAQLRSNNYCALDFLKRIKAMLPELAWAEYSEGQTRYFTHRGFSPEFEREIEAERLRQDDPSVPLVHFFTGKKGATDPKTISREDENRLSLVSALNDKVAQVSEIQQSFLTYLNELPRNSFTKIVSANYDHALAVAKNLSDEDWTPETEAANRATAIDMLHAIKRNPKPVYSAREYTSRLFALGPSMTYLKSEVRQALTKGWIEFDLQNAHLAIIAKDWGIPELTSVLKKGSIWDALGSSFPNLSEDKKLKKQLKNALYALVYGDSKRNIKAALGEQLGDTFLSLSLINTIFEAREREMARLKDEPSARIDCFGRELALDESEREQWDNSERSRVRASLRRMLSQKAQAVELLLMKPALEVSKTTNLFCVMTVYQFDGFSVHCKDKKRVQQYINRICKLTNRYIKSLGYETKIDYEVLQ